MGHTLHSSTLLCLVSGTPCNASHYYSAACFFRLVNPTLRPSRSFMPLPHAACLPASVPTRSRPAGRRDYTRLPQKVVPAVPAPTLPSHRWCQLRCTPPISVHVPAASPPPQVAAEAEPRTVLSPDTPCAGGKRATRTRFLSSALQYGGTGFKTISRAHRVQNGKAVGYVELRVAGWTEIGACRSCLHQTRRKPRLQSPATWWGSQLAANRSH